MADRGFPKDSRLLTAADYQAVFDNSRYKVSCRHFLILAKVNQSGNPRLGMVVAKKNLAKSVMRNRVKRLIRESFRHHGDVLGGLDLIVLVRMDTDKLSNASLYARLEKLWQDLRGKCAVPA